MPNAIKQTNDEQGNLHSYNDEPAIEYAGDKVWYHHDKVHRDDGPAVINANGDKIWYRHGKRHREDGPAIEYSNGDKEWYCHGHRYSFHEWLKVSSLSNEEKMELLLSYA